jgi:hypothetical protein
MPFEAPHSTDISRAQYYRLKRAAIRRNLCRAIGKMAT